MQQMVEWIGRHLWQIILALSIFIQITPIKISPWSALFKWIGKALTSDISNKIETLATEVEDLKKQRKEDEKDRIRWEILDFANSCRNGRKHTRDEFQHIVDIRTKYEKLLKETNDTNGVFEVEYQYIIDLYAERMKKNDFL